MSSSRTKPSITSLVAFAIIMPTVYVLSYAPFVRLSIEWHLVTPELFNVLDGEELPIYRPVDWLIDETPLERPLVAWSGIWRVQNTFEAAAISREARNDPPQWVDMH